MKRALLLFSMMGIWIGLAFGQPAKSSSLLSVRDAGVALTKAGVDAGVPEPMRGPAPASAGEVDKLKKELAELRVRVVDLETKAAKTQTLTSDIERLAKRLDELRAQFDAELERKDAAERELANRKAQTAQAGATINSALVQLSQGNTSNVDGWLRSAEQQYTGNAQKLVGLARAALVQGDLNSARQYLNLALIEAAAPPSN